MADIVGNLIFKGLGQAKNLRVDNLATDPAAPSLGQFWYNTAEGVYKGFDGVTVISFASGGNTADLLAELNAIETGAGLNPDGTYATPAGSNYLGGSTSLKNADQLLDTQIKATSDAVVTEAQARSTLQAEVDAVENGAGLNTDGTYAAPVGSNYLGGASSLKQADTLIDAQVKINSDAIAANAAAVATKVSKAGDSMTGNLAFGGTSGPTGVADPVNAGDAVNKAYVDNKLNGLTWLPPVDDAVTALPSGKAAGYRVLNETDGKIYTMGASAWDAGTSATAGSAVMVRADESGWTTDGTSWVQFTGAGQITAGVGLVKTGNVIDINLGAGIAQLPTDEVGVDVYANGGLFLTTDGATSSTDGASQLAILLNGATLDRSINGLKVAASGITATELAASVAGAGLAGGAGQALSITAGTGIVVTADGVELDLAYADGRYINVAGDTMTGALVLAADPTAALQAATKQYVDAVNARINASTFVYDGTATSAASHVVNHNIGSKYCTVTVYDSADKVIIPDSVTANSTTQLTVTFASAITCRIVVTGLPS